MALEYTEEKLNSLDKETIIQLFLAQQEQLKQIDHHLQLVLEQLADLKRHRFGRSSERHGTDGQISFMEVDGQIVFFNEAEDVSAEDPDDCREDAPDTSRRRPKKKPGKREEDLEGLPVVVVEHAMEKKELEERFGQEGWKQLPDEIYRRYRFTPAKVEVEEHHVKVYAGKKTEEVVKAPHPGYLLKGSLVSPSLEAAVMNANTSMPSRFTGRSRNSRGTACIFPDRTWRTGRSSARRGILRSFMTTCMKKCTITMCCRRMRPLCW